ncbi:MAG: hypothetical protein ACLVDB_06410 [Anaeromassilibacillus sp.]
MKIDQREALRYLGYKGSEPDAEILHTIADCARELEESATPHHILQTVALSRPGADTLEFAGMIVHSRDLFNIFPLRRSGFVCSHFGCTGRFAAGACAKVSMSRAVVMQACAASLIRSYCDECQNQSRRKRPAAAYIYARAIAPDTAISISLIKENF